MPSKGWDGTKVTNLTKEEMDKIKAASGVVLDKSKPKPKFVPKNNRGKIAELLLNVNEVTNDDRELSNLVQPSSTTIPCEQANEEMTPGTENKNSSQASLANARFTACQIFCNSNDVQKLSSNFLPDSGSLSTKLSGNYISQETLDRLVNTFSIRIYQDNLITSIQLPLNLSKASAINKHVYMYLEYQSRTEKRILRACIKAYIIPDLVVPIIIGKNDLIGNSWIESKHLHGYDATLERITTGDPMLKTWLRETYGSYEMESEDEPIMTLAKQKSTHEWQGVNEMLNSLQEKLRSEPLENDTYYLVDPDQKSEDEHNRYYEDVDEDEDYVEGELPTNIEGTPEGLIKIKHLLERIKTVFSKDLSRKPAKVKPFRLDIDVEKWESLRQPNGHRRQSESKETAMREYINTYI